MPLNIECEATMLSESDSDEYWRTRVRESKLGAWASDQPELFEEASHLQHRLDARSVFIRADATPGDLAGLQGDTDSTRVLDQ